MIFLVQFGMNKHLQILKDLKFHSPYGLVQFFKSLLVLIYSKLHSKSCDYQNKYVLFLSTWHT